jgi:hypothetical protein
MRVVGGELSVASSWISSEGLEVGLVIKRKRRLGIQPGPINISYLKQNETFCRSHKALL